MILATRIGCYQTRASRPPIHYAVLGNFRIHMSMPTSLIPGVREIWVLRDGVESNRPATNLPLGSVGSNQIYRMVKKNALVVKNRRADLMGARGWTLLSLPQTL